MSSVQYPESLEGTLLFNHFGKDTKCNWTSSKDIPEAVLQLESGEVVKGVPSIARHFFNACGSDAHSTLDAWTRKNFSDEALLNNAEAINHYLQFRTFIAGHKLSIVDVVVRDNLVKSPKWSEVSSGKGFAHLLRWISHLDSIPALNGGKASVKATKERTKGIAGWHGNYDTNRLQGASDGNVVTRFPPEPSGYLHIGHIKAAMLNSHYATIYNGKMILRFDDTNPAKEKDDYVDSIMEDLKEIGISFVGPTHTSDYFDKLEQYAIQLLKSGKAFIDDTPLEQMRAERRVEGTNEGVESRCRNQTVEENLKLFDEMRAGSPTGLKCVMRAKIDMKSKNAALRDPSLYRCCTDPHFRTGTKYKAYPLYDFACPIVDSLEGVTHALRSSEYHDRNPLYAWVLEALNLRKVQIEDFSRLNFAYVLLSKRKLNKLVDNGAADGWSDPRFPTIRGILRRGMTVEALREFILSQGASKAQNLMDMSKLWALNKQIIDDKIPRYTVVDSNRTLITLSNTPAESVFKSVPRHKKQAALGNKVVTYSNRLYIDAQDAKDIKDNEEVTLMDWGNAIIRSKTNDGLVGELNLTGDFKNTAKKLTWLADSPDLVPVTMRKYFHLITKEKLEEEEKFEDFLNQESVKETTGFGDPAFRTLNKGDRLQVERKGYFIVDSPFMYPNKPVILVQIPDGKQ